MKIHLKLLSSLEKVFSLKKVEGKAIEYLSILNNETASFQAAYALEDAGVQAPYVTFEVRSPISDFVRVRRVRQVPVGLATFADADENYLSHTGGLYPDLLDEIGPHGLRAWPGQWQALWLDVDGKDLRPGRYTITLRLGVEGESAFEERSLCLEVIGAQLAAQRLIHTKWLHTDCLAQYYAVAIFSEEYWRITENFVRAATRRGINMILTPIHTPPLDTRVGGERPAVQLVDIALSAGQYRFGFEKLDRWIDMCQRAGARYFEMAHLFTQWGANYTPKIISKVDGEQKRIFGWDVRADDPRYKDFLDAYLPALTAHLKKAGVADRCYFHISDEPESAHLESYRLAKSLIEKHLEGFDIIDALSDFSFYQQGVVKKPVCANNHIEPFIQAKVPGLWTYYCTGQYKRVSNMFMSMPSARNRILGIQLYLYNIEGFLHWGYNFYNAQYSDYPINPYLVTDADGFVPSGDPFQVYPGAGGVPEESIRMMVTAQAIYDLRALETLEALCGREHVVALIDRMAGMRITFENYPASADFILSLREEVNRQIAQQKRG